MQRVLQYSLIVGTLILGWTFCLTCNRAPFQPSAPLGPSLCRVDSVYSFRTVAADPDGDDIRYRFDWGDGDTTDGADTVPSGCPSLAFHAWLRTGTFEVRAQAKDAREAVSVWSEGHQVTVPNSWLRTFGGTGFDYGLSTQQTSDGGYIITGYTDSYGAGDWDVWLIKTDELGHRVWDKTFGGTGDDYGQSLQQTSDGGYIIAGYTHSYGAGGADVWLIKTDSSRNKVWDKTFGGTGDEMGYSVQQTFDGGYIVTGCTDSYGAGGWDAWLVKTDAVGNKIWDKTFGGTDLDIGRSVQQTSDGGYVITGYTESYGAGFNDVWLVRTNSSGDKVWDKTFDRSAYDYGNSVRQTSDGGYVIIGYTESDGDGPNYVWLIKTDSSGNKIWDRTLDGAEWANSVQQTHDGGYVITGQTVSNPNTDTDVWLVKTDASGNEEWERSFGGWAYEGGNSVQQTSDGGYVIAGYAESCGAGNDDVWLIKTDANGQ